jgi:hypothetical protein
MKKRIKKLVLTKETVKNLNPDDQGRVNAGTDTATDNCTYTCGNSCPACAASKLYACFSPPTGG